MVKIEKIKIIVFTCFIILMNLNCQNKTTSNIDQTMNLNKIRNKFEWLPTECAPKEYPVRVHKGSFSLNKNVIANIPSGGRTVQNGWGKQGSMYVVGEDFKSIPDHLEITWMSYTENKFYTGSFDLPQDEMLMLFNKGFIDRMNNPVTYSSIICGMAPGGIVSLWLIGAGKTKEIAHFKAVETEISMKDFVPDAVISREEYVINRLNGLDDDVKIYLQKEGVTYGKWTEYRKRYEWKPEFKLTNKGEFYEIFIDYFNGEHIYTVATNPGFQDYQALALPKYAKLYWEDENKNIFGSKLYFDEEEVKNAFETIARTSKNNKIDLLFQVDKYNDGMEIFLKSDTDNIKLEKTRIKIFETTK